MKRTRALARLEQRLDSDPCAILSATEVRLLDGEVRRALLASFTGIEPSPDPQRRHDRAGRRLERAAVRLAARAEFETCRWPRGSHNTVCGRLRAVICGRSVRISRAGISSFSASRRGWRCGAARIASSPAVSDSWMPLRDGVRRQQMIIVMTGKRILKPTRCVVDMRHYSTRKLVTCHRRFQNASSAWRSSSARLWSGSPITCPKAMSTRMCRAGGIQVVAAVAARSSRNWTARLGTSSGIVHGAVTTDGSMGGKTRRGIASTPRARRRRVHRRRPRIERRAGMHRSQRREPCEQA